MDEAQKNHIRRICRDVLGPLVRSDGGDLFVVGIDGDEVRLHLTGTCSGCPGMSMTRDDLIVPALCAVAAQVRVVITTGIPMPDGAERA